MPWYSIAKRWVRGRLPHEVSAQLAATLRRIARLPPTIGAELERLGCGRHKFAFVAWARGAAERERRFAEVVSAARVPYGKDWLSGVGDGARQGALR